MKRREGYDDLLSRMEVMSKTDDEMKYRTDVLRRFIEGETLQVWCQSMADYYDPDYVTRKELEYAWRDFGVDGCPVSEEIFLSLRLSIRIKPETNRTTSGIIGSKHKKTKKHTKKMTRFEIEMINEVTTAAMAGKPVQKFVDGVWIDIKPTELDFSASDARYRVRPDAAGYLSDYNFMNDMAEHGMFVGPIDAKEDDWSLPVNVRKDGFYIIRPNGKLYLNNNGTDVNVPEVRYVSFNDAAKKFVWRDGSPCGLIPQEVREVVIH